MNIDSIVELDNKFVIGNYARKPIAFTHGKGCTLFDSEGRAYTDFFAGVAVNSLGYAHPTLTEALCAQVKMITHSSNVFYSEQQLQLAAELARHAPGFRSFFCNSGAEANECALKLALKYFFDQDAPRTQIVTAVNSFHGRTLATLALTGQVVYHPPFKPFLPEITHVAYNDIQALADAVDENTAAVLLETIQGEGGVIEAGATYLQAARELCSQTGALLIVDEVQTGVGRTGTLFSFQQSGVTPDIFTLAKGLGGGVPIGAALAKDEIAQCFKPGDHGSTFGGNALACAAALSVLRVVSEPSFLNGVSENGEYLLNKLRAAQIGNPKIVDVRGKGLMIGIELIEDTPAGDICQALLKAGFVTGTAKHNTLRLTPPLIISRLEIDRLIDELLLILK